jgi:drug/metabolite transporter (DMT)-like permease
LRSRKQLGVVDPVSRLRIASRLAAVLLFAWCALRRETLEAHARTHFAALGVGFFTFALNYAFVYWAEERVTSAVVAVLFAALAFVNLVVFRVAFGQRAPLAGLGCGGSAFSVSGCCPGKKSPRRN